MIFDNLNILVNNFHINLSMEKKPKGGSIHQ